MNETIAVILDEGESAADIEAAAKPAAAAAPPPPTPPHKGEGSEAPAPVLPRAMAVLQRLLPALLVGEGRGGGSAEKGERFFASPLARRIAKLDGIDLSRVTGSGPHGRVVKRSGGGQAEGLTGTAPATRGSALAPAMGDEEVLKLFEPGSYELEPHDSMRKIIAKRLTQAKQTIPHFSSPSTAPSTTCWRCASG